MRAGAATITPRSPGPLAGYAAREGALSTGTHDELEAALLVLDDGRARFGWLSLDAIGVTEALAARLRDAVIAGLGDPSAAIVVAASHSHSAPLGWVGSIHPGHAGEVDEHAVEELVERVTVLASQLGAAPPEAVEAVWSSAPAEGLGTNRLDPSGPHDDRVGMLALTSVATGAVRAVVFDTATHPTVLGPSNLLWSADWPGAARSVLRAALGAVDAFGGGGRQAPTVLFLQGAAGDVSTRFTRRGDDFGEVARLGSIAAAAALRALADSSPLPAALTHRATTLELERRPLPSPDAAERELAEATAARESLRMLPDLDPGVRIAQARLDGAVVQRRLVEADTPTMLRLPISVLAIGDVAWVHVPVELFASVGATIRDHSPFTTTRIVGYADGYSGYLVDRAALASGSYEALSTVFPAHAPERLASAVTDLLKELR